MSYPESVPRRRVLRVAAALVGVVAVVLGVLFVSGTSTSTTRVEKPASLQEVERNFVPGYLPTSVSVSADGRTLYALATRLSGSPISSDGKRLDASATQAESDNPQYVSLFKSTDGDRTWTEDTGFTAHDFLSTRVLGTGTQGQGVLQASPDGRDVAVFRTGLGSSFDEMYVSTNYAESFGAIDLDKAAGGAKLTNFDGLSMGGRTIALVAEKLDVAANRWEDVALISPDLGADWTVIPLEPTSKVVWDYAVAVSENGDYVAVGDQKSDESPAQRVWEFDVARRKLRSVSVPWATAGQISGEPLAESLTVSDTDDLRVVVDDDPSGATGSDEQLIGTYVGTLDETGGRWTAEHIDDVVTRGAMTSTTRKFDVSASDTSAGVLPWGQANIELGKQLIDCTSACAWTPDAAVIAATSTGDATGAGNETPAVVMFRVHAPAVIVEHHVRRFVRWWAVVLIAGGLLATIAATALRRRTRRPQSPAQPTEQP